jgi:cysteinyl-tRNA synthetase
LNTEIQIEEFISTNYNTKGAVSSLLQLVAKTNIYLHDLEQKRSLELLQEIEGLIRNWLLKFGFGHHIQVPNVFSKSSFYSQNESLKVWNDFANFRSLIRKEALDLLKSDPILAKKLLIACDAVRENAASKGVQLEDAGKSHRVKLINTGKN